MTSQIQLLPPPASPHTSHPPHRAFLTPLSYLLANSQRTVQAVVRVVLSTKWSAVNVSPRCDGYGKRGVGSVCMGVCLCWCLLCVYCICVCVCLRVGTFSSTFKQIIVLYLVISVINCFFDTFRDEYRAYSLIIFSLNSTEYHIMVQAGRKWDLHVQYMLLKSHFYT